ncbi:MAG TPA: hypothetical protein VK524_30105 [Polyangiaceae bacterium]|nr:hypothetical protein [Polyangiaceae bacterium]
MERRVALRARTDFRVITRDGLLAGQCRGIEVSPMGIVLDRGRDPSGEHDHLFVQLELVLPERYRPIRAIGRPIWRLGSQQAFKFIRITDVDRLTLAEHLDLVRMRGNALC